MAVNTLTTGNGFLTSFNSTTPKLFVTAETDSAEDFDQITLQKWREEGFDVTYLAYGSGGRGYTEELKTLGRNMGVGDSFGIVAYGDAAAACLETFRRPTSRLCALVAYYPSSIPDPHSTFPIGLKVLVHLAGTEVGVTRNAEVLGIQGKRRTTTKKIPPGTGQGGMLKLAYPSYTYDDVEPGFAEYDLEEYEKLSERIAWSRSLDCVRKAFKVEVDLERIWEEYCNLKFVAKDVDKVMATMVEKPYINHIPTLTGGLGKEILKRFYEDYFIPDNPPSFKMKLVSRTIGVDRVVDEMVISFDHTQEISWMLPSVPPTNKHVEVALVAVVCIRGGKLYRLLDPKYIPPTMKNLDIHRLPVAGAESARKVLDEGGEPSNEMMDDW